MSSGTNSKLMLKLGMKCLICEKEANFIAHALMAPWLAKLIGGGVIRSRLFECNSCDFKFFEYRFSALEVSQIYSSYRSKEYESLRKTWEPWYTSGINNLYAKDNAKSAVSRRKERMAEQFQQANIKLEFKNCLDFGGDDGQFFPQSITGNRYLVDPSSSSGSSHNTNIKTVKDIDSISENLELVMCCMVLEHLSSFSGLMNAVTAKLCHSSTEQKGFFYLEIPRDGFKVGAWARTITYYKYLTLVAKFPKLFIALDFLTGLSRQYFRTIPIFGIVKQSEHINYFSRKAIINLVSKNLEVIHVSNENLKEKYGHFRLGFLALIARRTN